MEILIAGAVIGVLIVVGLFVRAVFKEIFCTEKQWEDLLSPKPSPHEYDDVRRPST